MSTFLLIRHGSHDLLGRVLTGRTREVHLNAQGKLQSAWLAQKVLSYGVNAVFSSPLARCMETAQPIALSLGMQVECLESLNEVDFGAWSGMEFAELQALQEWRAFNKARSFAAPPAGESVAQVQVRMLAVLQELGERYPDGCMALVSHADVIKAAMAYCLGVPIDLFHRTEISPGSLSVVRVEHNEPRIECVNLCAERLFTRS